MKLAPRCTANPSESFEISLCVFVALQCGDRQTHLADNSMGLFDFLRRKGARSGFGSSLKPSAEGQADCNAPGTPSVPNTVTFARLGDMRLVYADQRQVAMIPRPMDGAVSYRLHLDGLRPYFAEIPYYIWGEVNYDSMGDCKRPTDRQWTWAYFCHRNTKECFTISHRDVNEWVVESHDPLAARTAYFLATRCNATTLGQDPAGHLGEWNHRTAAARAARVESEFKSPELSPFDNGHLFWGSWKWIGGFGTEFTWVGRYIMHSVVNRDTRAVVLCIHWLRERESPIPEGQSRAIHYALERLTGLSFDTDRKWVRWYDRKGKHEYPEPDFDVWAEDFKKQYREAP